MTSQLLQAVAASGHLIPQSTLIQRGFTYYRINQAVRTGQLVKVGSRWVATPAAEQLAISAVVHGGKLTGSSALASLKIWDTVDPRVHVLVPSNSHGTREPGRPLGTFVPPRFAPTAVVKHWGSEKHPSSRCLPWRVSVSDALITVARTAAPHQFVASADSALYVGAITLESLMRLEMLLPRGVRRYLRLVNGRAESGLESIVRVLCQPFVRTIEIQVRIPGLSERGGVGRLDILINGWLNIELDGSEFHTTPSSDRRRDAYLVSLGYRVHRFGYAQVIYDWPRVEATIRELLRYPPRQIPRRSV